MAPLTRDSVHQSLDAFMDMFLADQEKPNRLNNGNGVSIRSTTPKNGSDNDDPDADVPAMEAISDNIFGCFPGAGHRQVPIATNNIIREELMESTKSMSSTKSLKKKKSNASTTKEDEEQEQEEEMTGKEKVNDILARKGVQLSSSSSSSDENEEDDMNNSMARSFVNSMFGGNNGGNPFGMGILAAISEHTEDPSEANGGGGDDRSTRSDWLSLKSSKSRRNSFNENGNAAGSSAHSTIVETFLQSEIASTFSNLSEMLIKFRRSQSVSSSKASSVTTDVRSMKSNTTTKTSKKQTTIHEEDENEDTRSDNTERDSSTEDNDDEQRESAPTSTSVTTEVKPEDIVKTASALSHLLVKHQDPVVLAPTGVGGAIRMNRSRSSASFVSGVGRSRGMSMDTSDNMSLSQFGSPTSVVTGTGSMIDPKLSTDSSYVYTPPIRLNSKLLLGGGGGGGASVTSTSNNKRRSKKSKKHGMSLSREFSIEQQDSEMMSSPVPSVSVME